MPTVPKLPFEVLPPFPPDDPRWRELAFLRIGGPNDRVWRRMDKFGARCRRLGTCESPLAFAFVYLGRGLKPVRPLIPGAPGEPDVPDRSVEPAVSFSDFHLALCAEAKNWMNGGPRRMGIIAPRGAGKSWWTFEALPLWALAHGHRHFFMGYAHSTDQAKNAMNNIRKHLASNELLLYDFPELTVPTGARNNAQLVETEGGLAFSTSGIDKVTLGARHEYDRPDLITIDDGEPNEGNYAKAGSKGSKEDRLETIRDVVLRMTPEAAVLLSGTVVMPGSIGHDLVKKALGEPTADWVDQEQFSAMYFNAILDEGLSSERSMWPRRWSLDWLLAERERNPTKYALHYANQPATRGGRYWQQEDFRDKPHFPRDHWIMWVDPAVVPKEGRDKTAVVVVSVNATRDWAVVEFAFQDHITMTDLGRRIAEYKRNRPEIRVLEVYIEKNNGGEMFKEIIEPLVKGCGIRLHLEHSGREVSATGERGKFARIESAYAYYQANRVWHARSFTELEALLTSYPKIRNFDLPDALAGALRVAFAE